MSQSETILTMVLALFVIAWIFLIREQIVRERERKTKTTICRENEFLRRENSMSIVAMAA